VSHRFGANGKDILRNAGETLLSCWPVNECVMHMTCSKCRRDGRLRLRCVGAKTVIPALVATLLSLSMAEAATCLASAEEVRKLTPKAWPKWTYGPNRERCWYSGEKPVFAKAPPSQASMPRSPVPAATTGTAPEEDHKSAAVSQPWVLEHRWWFEIRPSVARGD
jgi:hypothetical protein